MNSETGMKYIHKVLESIPTVSSYQPQIEYEYFDEGTFNFDFAVGVVDGDQNILLFTLWLRLKHGIQPGTDLVESLALRRTLYGGATFKKQPDGTLSMFSVNTMILTGTMKKDAEIIESNLGNLVWSKLATISPA
jgi:hypothetical protein